jgi:hypothetical protein
VLHRPDIPDPRRDAILDRLLHALAEHNRGYHSDDTAIMVILA